MSKHTYDWEDCLVLDEDALVITSSSLTRLEQRLEELILRAEHYGEYQLKQSEHIEMLRGLREQVREVRLTGELQ